MRISPRWVKQHVAIASASWTPVVAPLDFDYVALRCDTSEIAFRTDVNDAGSEDTLAANVQDGVIGSYVRHGGFGDEPRFPEGITVCWVKSVAANATLLVTWVL